MLSGQSDTVDKMEARIWDITLRYPFYCFQRDGKHPNIPLLPFQEKKT